MKEIFWPIPLGYFQVGQVQWQEQVDPLTSKSGCNDQVKENYGTSIAKAKILIIRKLTVSFP